MLSIAARPPFEVTVQSPEPAPYRGNLGKMRNKLVLYPVSSIDLIKIHSHLSKAFGDVIPLTRFKYADGGDDRIPTTVTEMNLLRPFEPRLVLIPWLPPEKEESISNCSRRVQIWTWGCEGYGNWIGSPNSLGPKRQEARRLEIISLSQQSID